MSLRHPVSMICSYMYLQCITEFNICIHMYIHTKMPTYVHTRMNIHIHTYIHRCLSIDTRNDGALCHVRVVYVNMRYLYICSQSINISNLLIYTCINTYVHAQMPENNPNNTGTLCHMRVINSHILYSCT